MIVRSEYFIIKHLHLNLSLISHIHLHELHNQKGIKLSLMLVGVFNMHYTSYKGNSGYRKEPHEARQEKDMDICIRAKNNAWAIARLKALHGFRESKVTFFLMLQSLSKVSATGNTFCCCYY